MHHLNQPIMLQHQKVQMEHILQCQDFSITIHIVMEGLTQRALIQGLIFQVLFVAINTTMYIVRHKHHCEKSESYEFEIKLLQTPQRIHCYHRRITTEEVHHQSLWKRLDRGKDPPHEAKLKTAL